MLAKPISPTVSLRTNFVRWLAVCCLVVSALCPVFGQTPSSLAIERLTTNGRLNPLGIPAGNISLGWSSTSSNRGVKQEAYQIRVRKAGELVDLWNSGQVQSTRQVDVSLSSNLSLQAATRYHWQVKVWDDQGAASEWSETAWFETGLLAEADWGSAEWITRAIESPNPADWTNYTATIDFTLQREAFGVFLRSSANCQNAYMFQINVTGANPVLKPHKRTNGAYTLLSTIDLSPFGFTNASLTGTRNILQFIVSGSTITTKLNGTTIDTRSDISFANGLVGFRTYGSEAGQVHKVQVVDSFSGSTLIDPDFSKGENGFGGGVVSNGVLDVSGTTDAVFGNLPSSLPLLRGKFTTGGEIVSARLYASAHGIYQVSINGRKVGDQFLAPGWTDYDSRIQSQTYDVTDLVQSGTNVVGASLADGWHHGTVGLNWKKVYGDQPAFVARIKVTYSDGSFDWFATDTSWKASDGPCVQGDLQDGEIYNANLEQLDWDTVGFDDAQWATVETVPSASARLVPQPDEPIRAVEVLTAKSRNEILPGTWIYDLGQNMVGVPRVALSGTPGQTITLRHGEELYRTGPLTGQLYTENLRGAKATDAYTFAAGGNATYQPTFTQHGFRYIEITGTTNPPAVADVQGVVLASDLPGNGDLETSNAMLNQLVSNIRWGQRGNFLSIPTDTPARDERLGWTGDINVFAPAAARFKDTRAFLSKWMDDVRDSQKGNGNIPAVVPQPLAYFDDTGVGWSDAVITIPHSVWRATGDERIIRENWEAMKDFYQFVHNSATGDGDLLEQGRSSWFSGDWLSLEQNWNRLEEHKVIATAYFAEDTRMMAEMAEVMGEAALATQWSALVPQIRAAFVNAYRTPNGSIYQGTQTAYALALGMDMISDPAQCEQTATKFVEKLAADNNHLRTGFLGTPWLLPALSKIGRDDLAMRILLNEDYPSWGFPISMGATTMWERWNSIQPNGEFGPVDMNSFNHYAYGAVADWMFGKLGGIQALEPGYKTSRIVPLMGFGGLTSAQCTQQTAFGRLEVEWTVSESGNVLNVEVPVNTTTIVHVPQSVGTTVHEGAYPAETAPGVQFLGIEGDARLYSVGSGSYVFSWIPPLDSPYLLEAVSESGQMTLTWPSVAGATSYDLKRSTVTGGPYTTIGGNLTATSYTDTNVIKGKTYYYVVSGKNSSGESGNSHEATAQPSIVINSGFESPSTGTYIYNPGGGTWQFVTDSGVATNSSLFTNGNPVAPAGTQVAFLQRLGTIIQTLTGLVPGITYEIVHQAAQRATGSSWNLVGQTWDVAIDGTPVASFDPGQGATSYTEYSAQFTATAESHVLTFVGTNHHGGDNTVFIDDVKISPAATPISEHERQPPSMEWLPDGSGGPEVHITVRHAVPGHEYVLQSNAGLSADGWSTASQPQLGNGSDLLFIVPFLPFSGRGFFRILILD